MDLGFLNRSNAAAAAEILLDFRTDQPLILVFDAYKVKGATREVEQSGGISIVYTKEAETADMYIEKVSKTLTKNNLVRVVTSDALEQLIILGNGALRVPARAFYEEVSEAEEEIRRIIEAL